MVKALHIAQDKYGYWFLSAEHTDGALELRAHQVTSCNQLIKHAEDMTAKSGLTPAAVVIEKEHRPPPLTEAERPDHYTAPEPRKAATDGL